MRAQPGEIGRPEHGEIDRLRFHGIEQGERPVGALEQDFVGGRLHLGRELGEILRERRADAGIAGLAERGDELALESGRSVAGHRLEDRGQPLGNDAMQAEQGLRGGEALVVGSRIELGEKLLRLLLDLGLERPVLVPFRREREHAARRTAAEQFAEGGGKVGRHRRGVLERFRQRFENAALEPVRSHGRGGQRNHELGGGGGIVLRGDACGELRHERRECLRVRAGQRCGDTRRGDSCAAAPMAADF